MPLANLATPAAELERQLTLQEAADLTGSSVSTVRRWIARGELRAYYYGRRVIRIDPADLRAQWTATATAPASR